MISKCVNMGFRCVKMRFKMQHKMRLTVFEMSRRFFYYRCPTVVCKRSRLKTVVCTRNCMVVETLTFDGARQNRNHHKSPFRALAASTLFLTRGCPIFMKTASLHQACDHTAPKREAPACKATRPTPRLTLSLLAPNTKVPGRGLQG